MELVTVEFTVEGENMQEKILIWGNIIPYNTGKKKRDDMQIGRNPRLFAMVAWIRDVFGTGVMKNKTSMDTWTYLDEIKKGKVSEYYSDTPYLQAFLVSKSDTAVIIAPGGGFCNQSRQNEGYAIAEKLNRAGISAFVLDYRLNPYRAPAYYLDMQRAVRHVRYHAKEYGLNSDKIGVMGFSAGGYVAGGAAILLGNAPVIYPGYFPDEIDQINGIPTFVGMLYPVVDFEKNPNMLAVLIGEDFFDEKIRRERMKEYSLTANLKAGLPPQYVCYGDKDTLGGMDRYVARVKKLGNPVEVRVLQGAGHGFAATKKYAFWIDEYITWIKKVTG